MKLDLDQFAGFSPGPWTDPRATSAGFSVWKGETQIAACRWLDEAGIPESACVQGRQEAEANASLIAAAPDLLVLARNLHAENKRLRGALKRACNHLTISGVKCDDAPEALAQARAALKGDE